MAGWLWSSGSKPVEPVPDTDDSRWEKAGVVEKLYMYPMKSCAPTSLNNAKADKFGLADDNTCLRDRQFMVVDAKHRFVTGRKVPKLVLVKVIQVPQTQKIQFFAFGAAGKLLVDLPNINDPSLVIQSEVFGQLCNGFDLGNLASAWITSYIDSRTGGPYRIIYHPFHPESNPVNVRTHETPVPRALDQMKADDTCLYADGFGYLLCTTSSIAGLNEKLTAKGRPALDERSFRPNIYVKNDGPPFEEDNWAYIKISGVIFRVPKICTRCIFTTVDPKTGMLDPDMEPLKTLRSFRLSTDKRAKSVYGNSPLFGLNLGLDEAKGELLHVGDTVYVIRKKKEHEQDGASTANCKVVTMSILLAASALAIAFLAKSRLSR